LSEAIEKIKKTIKGIRSLPTLPTVVLQIMDLLSNPNTSVQDLSKIISLDPSLTTAILKLVNSAYYGFPRQVSTINHALVILGFTEIRNITFTVSTLRTFPEAFASEIFNREKFWQHSIECALGAKALAENLRYRVSGETFIAGLTHDIGKIILEQYLHSYFLKVVKIMQSEKLSMFEAEKKVLKISHAEIGAWLARQWNLPLKIEKAIKFHHTPEEVEFNSELTTIVHLSNILSHRKLADSEEDKLIPSVHPVVWENLKSLKPDINESYLEFFISLFEKEKEKAKTLFNILNKKTTNDYPGGGGGDD